MSNREKMAILAAIVYITIMSIGMLVLTQVFHMVYGKPSMLKVLVYPTFLAVSSSLIFYYKFFRGTSFNKIKWNLWLLEFAVVAIGMLASQIFLGKYTNIDMGILFAWVFYKTGSIIPTMIYHWFWDMFGLLGQIVPVQVMGYIQMFQNIFTLVASTVLVVYILIQLKKGESGPRKKVVVPVPSV